MRRKNRKWVATAVVLYLFVMYSAYRWAVSERPTDGPILDHIQREEVRKFKERRAREAAALDQAQPQPTGQSRLEAAAPAFVAARYDQTHVVFMVVAETEARFSPFPLSRLLGTPTKIDAPSPPSAPLAGLQELWEPDSHALHFFPQIIQQTHPGDQWTLSLSPDSTIPVVIERPVVAPTGCSLALGFLASVAPGYQNRFALSPREYFVVRHTPVESANPPVESHIVELPQGKLLPTVAKQVEQQLTERMKQEVAKIDARLLANAASPGATAGESAIGSARPRFKEWIHADQGLAHGEGTLDFDVRGFRLTPDAAPRLYVRARWKLADANVFLMTAWFRADVPAPDVRRPDVPEADTAAKRTPGGEAKITLLSADSSWSTALRQGEASGSLGDTLDFQSVLNEFDADHDGWAELLIHSYEGHSDQGPSSQGPATTIALYLYTDLGLVPMKAPLRRDTQSPESCIDP
jgi:hypothetical protein